MPMLPDMGVERAWIDLARGRLDAVQAFLESHGLEDGNGNATLTDIHGVHDDADLLVGRWLLLRQQYPRTIAVLTDALQAAVAGGRLDTVVRARIDLAVARHLEGERAQAFTQLDAAVDAALGRGYHQVFVEAPAQLRHLIAQRLADGVESEPARSFLEGLVAEAPSGSPTPAPVAEPLSPSERKVLEHLVGGLSNKEIAQALFISPNTVKTHIRRIYGKLGAKNRADAIRLARALA
jgi:LuxR family maltose regulon positive regulatory protein